MARFSARGKSDIRSEDTDWDGLRNIPDEALEQIFPDRTAGEDFHERLERGVIELGLMVKEGDGIISPKMSERVHRLMLEAANVVREHYQVVAWRGVGVYDSVKDRVVIDQPWFKGHGLESVKPRRLSNAHMFLQCMWIDIKRFRKLARS